MNDRNAENSRLLVTIPIIFFVIGILSLIFMQQNDDWSVVLGAIAVFTPIPSIVTAAFGISYAKKAQKNGNPLTGLVYLGITEIIFSAIMILIVTFVI